MPSTYSNSLRIELIGKGEQAGTWDETTNENLGTLLEAAIAGHVEIALADANYSLTANNGSDDEARHASIKFTGTLTATRTITLPSLKSKMYIFENATNQSLVFDAGGTTRTVVAGDRVLAYVDNSGNVADQITSLAALKITSADIDGGTIDNTPIGGATPAAGAFTTLSSTGNTTLGDASGDTVTFNAASWSAPNGFVIDTTKLVLDLNSNFGLGVVPQSWSQGQAFEIDGAGNAIWGNSSGDIWMFANAYFNSGNFKYASSSIPSSYIRSGAGTGEIILGTAASGTAGNTITFTEGMRLTNARYFKASNTGSYGSAAGLGNLSTNTSHNFQSDQNNTTLASINGNTGGTVTNYDSHLATGATGKHFAGYINTGTVYAVAANGDVINTNNSYGAISDRKLKNLLQQKYGADYYERFKQIQFWTYTMINDPTNQKMLGVVAQELQDIFPGLVESTPDMHEVKKSRAVIKKIQRTRTEQQSKTNRTIEEVDGRWTLIEETETVDVEVPMFEEHQVFDQNGNPVMQLVKAGVPEVLDADGKVLQPAVEPVYLPVIHRVPVIDEIEEQQEYTESVQKINPETGDPEVTLSVKYSILYQIAAMVIQELQFRNDEHTLIISDQTKEIALLTARIEALENK